ncbi:MAG: hypothetical protein LBP29_07400 [Treponema sp.]|jgi:hypothetical protein|nr:hypothetical protein [Treponema sp.]
MKKHNVVVLAFLFLTGVVFADEHWFSVGGGFSFVFDYTTATLDYNVPAGAFGGMVLAPIDESKSQTIKEFDYGGYLFFDARYVEFVITLAGGPADITVEYPTVAGGGEGTYTKTSFNIGFSVLGKYPFQVGPVVLFPLAGVDYIVYLTGAYPKADPQRTNGVHKNIAADFNTLWFKFGGGVDIPLKERLFVRVEALYGFGLENEFQKNGEDEAADQYGKVNWGWVNGPTARVGVGYKF